MAILDLTNNVNINLVKTFLLSRWINYDNMSHIYAKKDENDNFKAYGISNKNYQFLI